MNVIVILSALLVVACAAPQYGYQQPDSFNERAINSYNGLSPVNLQQPSGHRRGGEKYLPPGPTTVSPLVRKQFYVVSAPEDEDNAPKTKHLVLGRPQRNYRVVFIKAPNSNGGNVKYSAEFAPQEEKTVIYVLSKKDNELDASDIATPAPTPASKPEVFFIKYKTDEEAQKAQKEIQGEYDKLGGINEVADETTAPITSVIGSLDSLNADGSYNYQQVSSPQSPSSQYLPSAIKRTK